MTDKWTEHAHYLLETLLGRSLCLFAMLACRTRKVFASFALVYARVCSVVPFDKAGTYRKYFMAGAAAGGANEATQTSLIFSDILVRE